MKGVLSLHSLYTLLWANLGVMSMAILFLPKAGDVIRRKFISPQSTVKSYFVSHLMRLWRCIPQNLGISEEDCSFLLWACFTKFHEVKFLHYIEHAQCVNNVDMLVPKLMLTCIKFGMFRSFHYCDYNYCDYNYCVYMLAALIFPMVGYTLTSITKTISPTMHHLYSAWLMLSLRLYLLSKSWQGNIHASLIYRITMTYHLCTQGKLVYAISAVVVGSVFEWNGGFPHPLESRNETTWSCLC